MDSSVPPLRLNNHGPEGDKARTDDGSLSPTKRKAFLEGLKKKLPRLRRAKSDRNLNAGAADILVREEKPSSTARALLVKSPNNNNKTRPAAVKAPRGGSHVASDQTLSLGLAKWSEMLLEESQVSRSTNDLHQAAKKNVEEEEEDEITADSDSEGGGSYLSPRRALGMYASPRWAASDDGMAKKRLCAQLKALDDLRQAHPHVFER